MTGRERLDRARRLLDTAPPAPVPGQLPLDQGEPKPKPSPACDTGNPRCNATPTRPYPCGWRCDAHRPVPRTRPQ
ncbi:hypothetical protein SEA_AUSTINTATIOUS_38 [Streptomyces phage Austintatious]|uniref:Aromatic ring-opening dioxygenase LigA n=1 Tax=Streptomyces phage Austintatious TaxID=2500795 RepID=A0A411AXI4_9CAUD|nr:hypothetical protein HOV10_gp38 [Streptomyces phage Austintatious]QAX92799.1 hypothetical protein SEA_AUSTINTATIOUS_38 [Streptomyces phage Austintatious]